MMRGTDETSVEFPRLRGHQSAFIGRCPYAENDFNLNIPRYVDTFEPEEEIDVAALQKQITNIEAELAEVRGRMAGYLKELGVDV